jgi:LmbE family N-acetylglucosaminyl deacetylase
MNFSLPRADIYLPGGQADADAVLARVTHLCVAAHQDDIEIMAYAGIADCQGRSDRAFGGVVVTNGAGSARTGEYASMTDEQMQEVRRDEQREAARLGGYALQIQLAHPSSQVKKPRQPEVLADLERIFGGCSPEVVYLHQPADKHDTHVAVLARCIEAIRRLPVEKRPRRILGCEVWRNLDWLVDSDKVALDSGRFPELALPLLTVFRSQVVGGKRYDLATLGRRASNATFHTSHAVDKLDGITWAVDLTPLVAEGAPSLEEFICAHLDRLREDVVRRVRTFS